ncbi:hypothetical protein MNBD_GAMMA07-921 [hydrothermal vent metagenome]|uniref:Uncharacterized protein n=1 Tax=hydrothermal vent metagenome TaxID=652676 RepID=A0A3B0WJ23_9ZZZZ
MKNETLATIADILPPSAPVSAQNNIGLFMFLLVLSLSIFAYVNFYRSYKQQLQRLKKGYRQKKINQRQLAFKLIHLLKKKSISSDDKIRQRLFEELNTQCQAACFSRNGLSENAMDNLFERVKQWI